MSGLKGDVRTLSRLSASLRRLPRVVAQKVTEAAAPVLTDLARDTFEASETPYGTPWAPGTDGKKITLRRSGRFARYIRYVGIGTKLRVALGVPYAKYQVGRRPVFPTQGKPLPVEYTRRLQQIAADVIRRELGVSS